jgi:hypothetical protein
MFEWLVHLSCRRRRHDAPGAPLAKLTQKYLGRYKERIVIENAADNDHGMRPHNVHYRVSAKLAKMVGADDGVVVVTPYVIYPRFELNNIVNV